MGKLTEEKKKEEWVKVIECCNAGVQFSYLAYETALCLSHDNSPISTLLICLNIM
jgi:hypothetical protein